jgi:hypothetical protein
MQQKLGQTNQKDYSMTAFNVVMTPSKFDIMYFKNSKIGLRVLVKDSFMFENIREKSFVQLYASNQTKFLSVFVILFPRLLVTSQLYLIEGN